MRASLLCLASLSLAAAACGIEEAQTDTSKQSASALRQSEPQSLPSPEASPEGDPTPTPTAEATIEPSPVASPEVSPTVVAEVTLDATVGPTATATPAPLTVTYSWPEGSQNVCHTDENLQSAFIANSAWTKFEERKYDDLPSPAGCTLHQLGGADSKLYTCAFDYFTPHCANQPVDCGSISGASVRHCSKPPLPAATR